MSYCITFHFTPHHSDGIQVVMNRWLLTLPVPSICFKALKTQVNSYVRSRLHFTENRYCSYKRPLRAFKMINLPALSFGYASVHFTNSNGADVVAAAAASMQSICTYRCLQVYAGCIATIIHIIFRRIPKIAKSDY
jgi:hypothetical protein